jgi:ATP-binding cassette, subfamily F, member 3
MMTIMANSLLIQVRDLSKSYGDKIIFKDAGVSIVEKQKIGVIGRNGAGKSTLFKMIMGDEEADTGEIQHLPELRLGYIPQIDPFEPEEIVIEFLQRYTEKPEWECAKVAGQFQLKGELLQKQIGALSGGFQMRVKLAATLLFEPNLLLLDEPTNYLDLSTLILLEQFLKSFRGGFLCITHDREFLKKTCTATMEVEHGKIVLHPEPLEDYLEFKQEQLDLAKNANKNIELKQKQLQTFVDRFGAKASMAKSAQSKAKMIDRLENSKIGIDNPLSTVRMIIPNVTTRTGIGLSLEHLAIGYPNKTISTGINLHLDKGKKVAILGDNGQGKSTLLKTIVGDLLPVSGTAKWTNGLKVAYYAQHVNTSLDLDLTVEKYLKETASSEIKDDEIFRMMNNFLFKKNDSQKQIKVLSGGEKARLCLAGMFLTKSDVLLLDEPTNHLDFETVEAMGDALNKFNGTVIVISHDRTFVNLIANEIWEVANGEVKRILGTYEDYVWNKEQLAEAEARLDNKPADKYADESGPKSAKVLDKAQRIQLYELRKDLSKLEKKIDQLKAALESNPNDSKSKAELETKELKWLETTEEIEKLS